MAEKYAEIAQKLKKTESKIVEQMKADNTTQLEVTKVELQRGMNVYFQVFVHDFLASQGQAGVQLHIVATPRPEVCSSHPTRVIILVLTPLPPQHAKESSPPSTTVPTDPPS